MPQLFLIPCAYSIMGVLYVPGIESLIAAIVIAFISSPLLFFKQVDDPDEGALKKISWKLLAVVAILVGGSNLMVVASSVGRSVTEIFSLEGVSEIAIQSTINRYEIDTDANSGNPVLLAISLFLIFVTKMVDRGVSKTLITLLPVVLYSILTTEKWPSFLAVIFLISGNQFSMADCKRRNVKRILLILVVVSGFMLISLMLRSGVRDFVELARYFGNYLFSQYYGLGYWLMKIEHSELQFGVMTFMGPLNQMGFYRREAGAGFESYMLYGMESNIYTAYKYLILDFGILGAFLLNVVWTIFAVTFRRFYSGRVSMAIYVFLFFSSLLSINVTPFFHNSTALAILMSTVFVMIVQKKSVAGK